VVGEVSEVPPKNRFTDEPLYLLELIAPPQPC
jgi:hypothetical protein